MHEGFGVGSLFQAFNEIVSSLFMIAYWLFKYIYSYLEEIDYTTIYLDIITNYSRMKETVVTLYNDNIDKDSVVHLTLQYGLYCIEYIKSFVLGNRIEPFNNNWISVSYIDQTDYHKQTLSFSFDETYDVLDTLYFFKDNVEIDYDDYFKEWFKTAKNVLFGDKHVYDCLVSMRLDNKYIYKVCDKDAEAFDVLPSEMCDFKFLSISYFHHELKTPIGIDIDNSAYLVGNEILSSTFVKRQLEYTFNTKSFDTDYVLKIMDDNLNVIELKSNEFIVLEKDKYKIVTKNVDVPIKNINEDYVVLDD